MCVCVRVCLRVCVCVCLRVWYVNLRSLVLLKLILILIATYHLKTSQGCHTCGLVRFGVFAAGTLDFVVSASNIQYTI